MSYMYKFKRKKPLKKKSDKPNKKAKDRAWKAFSDYIRLRDCLLTTGTTYECVCISCNRRVPYKSIQAGHLIPGRKNSVLFCDFGTNGQCVQCNIYKSGNHLEYRREMVKRYGAERIDEYEVLAKIPKSMTKTDYDNVCLFYKTEYGKLVGVL